MPRHGDASQPLLRTSDAAVAAIPPSALDQSREVASAPSQLGKAAAKDSVSFVVKTLTGQACPVLVRRTDTIASVKAQLHRHFGIPPGQHRILLTGVDLPDERMVVDCGITDGETVSLAMKLESPPEPLDPTLVAAMEKHGLTEAEQRQLHDVRVVDVDTFMAVRDEDFALSGIDINARRQEKLQGDRDAAQARYVEAVAQRDERVRREREAAAAAHERAMYEQTQGLLEDAGLSPHGREVVRALPDLVTLRHLDLAGMAELGLNLVDRRKLEAFCRSEPVQRAEAPGLQQVFVEELTMEEVLTEPERQQRHLRTERERQQREMAEEAQRQLEEQQRREEQRQEQQRRADENARKRAKCCAAVQRVLCWLCCPCASCTGVLDLPH